MYVFVLRVWLSVDVLCVEWIVKLCSLTHLPVHGAYLSTVSPVHGDHLCAEGQVNCCSVVVAVFMTPVSHTVSKLTDLIIIILPLCILV